MYLSGYNNYANATPSNLGGFAGKGVDMLKGKKWSEVGKGQAFGGLANDLGSFAFTLGSGPAIANTMANPTFSNYLFFGTSLPGYTNSLYYDCVQINEFKNEKK